MHLERLVGRHGMSEKKVVAFIVEGTSDEAALGSVMKEYFSSNEVQFVVVHGDITSQGTYQKTWDYIEKERNSLNRHTNMHLIFG